MECKIGEIRKVGNKWLQCIESACNKECYFYNRSLHKTIAGINGNDFGACNACFRSDNKSVIFKELEKIGEPYDDCGTILQRFKIYTNVTNADTKGLELHIYSNDTIGIEIKQNKEDMEEKKKKQTSLDLTKGIYEKFKGKTVQCLVNNKDGDLVNGYGIVCGYTNKYLIIGFTNGYEGCIKSFTDNVFLENRDFLSYRFWNISHVDDKPFIKPFNLESARSGKPVCTRDGRKARVVCFDKAGAYPVIALVQEVGMETCHFYSQDGKCADCGTEYDLMLLCEKKKGYVNIYSNMIHDTLEDADRAREDVNDSNYIETLEVEWEG